MREQSEAAMFAAELDPNYEPTIDLHGSSVDEARHDLESFLNHTFMHRAPAVKIIHGRGQEKLKHLVETTLKTHPLVDAWRGATDMAGIGAVTYAVLSRRP
ncbi:MAG: Smr/MutS family protein [Patescibacteria group bacterium]